MKKALHLLIILAFFLAPFFGQGQGKPNYVGEWYQQNARGKTPPRVDLLSQAPSDFTKTKRYNLKANAAQLSSILRTTPALLDLKVPYGDKIYTLNLARVEITAGNMRVRSAQGSASYTTGVQYRGIVNNNPAWIASVSLTTKDVMGFFSTDEGNFVITKEGLDLILYNDQVLKAEGIVLCQVPDTISYTVPASTTLVTGVGCRTVSVYFECDYAFYQSQGSSVQASADYVMAFFNQVSTLYANENVSIQVSDIFVWYAPDPYASMTSSSDILAAFRTNRGTSFNGNLAHFVSTRSLGGGVGYVDVVCNKAYAFGVSQVYTTYNNYPSYSWTVEVITHELGHNLGSPHTHSCSWSTGALDNCYTPEGSCSPGPAPIGGGTIMSYCHLTSYGINFNYGFGLIPGNRIRDRVLNATCIASNGSTAVPTSLSTTNLSGTTATLNWAPASGATTYYVQYRESASTNWTQHSSTTGTSINLTNLTANTNYNWQVRSNCSDFSAESTFATTGTTATGCNAPAQLSTSSITASSAILGWETISGATGYTVQYKPASATSWTSVNTGTNSLQLNNLTASTSYNWQVKADCSSYSTVTSFTTSGTTATGCNVPAQLSTSSITASSAILGWEVISGAASYTVQYKPASASSWTSVNTATNSLQLNNLTASTSYNWQLKADCSSYSTVTSFTTSAGVTATVCTMPSGMGESNITTSSATLTWTSAPNAQSYNVRVTEVGAKRSQNYNNVTGTSLNVGKLRSGRQYQWTIQTKCTDGTTSAFTTAKVFTTL
jgi:hypothetical protein